MVKKYEIKDALKEGFLGVPTKPKETEEDDPVKVTLLLPKDTMATIDQMVKNTIVGSRGRLIQLLIDDVWALQGEYNLIEQLVKKYSESKANDPQFTLGATMGMVGILRRLARYYGKDLLK